jgi:hypothetical protein
MGKMTYRRPADWEDLPLPIKLGILQTEVEMAETDEEKTNALAAVKRMEQTIEKLTPTPAPTRRD